MRTMRLSGFSFVMLGILIVAVIVLAPGLRVLVEQQQQIAALEQAVAAQEAEVGELQQQLDRWADPAYITTQARERLYYVKPGEVVYLVDNDLDAALQPAERAPVSDKVTTTKSDWMTQLLRSVTSAGVAEVVKPITIGVPDPVPADTAPPE